VFSQFDAQFEQTFTYTVSHDGPNLRRLSEAATRRWPIGRRGAVGSRSSVATTA
jgi:hypothetical protein